MSDLISRSAVIEQLIEFQKKILQNPGMYQCDSEVLGVINYIYSNICDIPPVEASTWIPCSERLPEERENPITRNYYPYPVIVELGNKMKDVRFYYFGQGHWWHGFTKMDGLVTHWFDIYLIPEPYGADMRKKV